MSAFAKSLEANPAPSIVGDVSLRYEPSMLIGETALGLKSWRPTVLLIVAIASLLLAIGTLLGNLQLGASIVLLIIAATSMTGSIWLERIEKRRRRFVANFATISLRLDFASPIAGYPRTIIVPFDDISALALVEQEDGAHCLLVDFTLDGRTLREVLVAFIPEAQRDEAERLERVLHGAFGLGKPPADSTALPYDESSFEA